MSKALVGKRAEIEIASLQLDDEIEAEWLPLIGITYDPKDDIIEVALEGVDHVINKPREVWVDKDGPCYPASRSSMRTARARSSFSEIP
jgi:Family of unknown function (DUF5335)